MKYKITYEKREVEVPTVTPDVWEEMLEKDPEQAKRVMDMQRKRDSIGSMLLTFKKNNGEKQENNRRYPLEDRL